MLLVLQETAPELLGIGIRRVHGPVEGEVVLKATCRHSSPSSALGCTESLIFGRVGSKAEGAGNCHSAVLVSMTRAFITCAP